MSTERRADAATAATGFTGLAASGVLREAAMRRGLANRKLTDPGARRSWPPSLDLVRGKHTRAKGKAQALYAGASVLGLASVTPAATGTTALVRRRKEPTFADRFSPLGKGLVAEGLKGSLQANKDRADNYRHRVPDKARATQYGVSTGTGALGSLAAHRILDHRAPHIGGKSRAAVTALAGGAAGIGSLPLSNRAVKARFKGYEATPLGVRRVKRPLKRPSSVATSVSERDGRGAMRRTVVPSDQRFAKDDRSRRLAIMAASSTPVVGPLAAAKVAASQAPTSQRRKAGATQFAGDAGGAALGTAGGAYAGAALSRNKKVDPVMQATHARVQQMRERIPGVQTADRLSAKLGESLRPAGAGSGPASRAVRAATKPLKGKAAAGAALGSIVGGSAVGQAGSYKATSVNLARERRTPVIKLDTGLTESEQRSQLQRKKRGVRLAAVNSVIGGAGVAAFAGSKLKAVKPATRATLERAALGTAIAGGASGSYAGMQGARTQRKDIKALEGQLRKSLTLRPKTYRRSTLVSRRTSAGLTSTTRRKAYLG